MLEQHKILGKLTPEKIAAFHKKVGTPEESGCFPWIGAKRPDGYGVMRFGMASIKVHRIAWVIANGQDIPEGRVIDHSCSNKGCVNPAHLEAVSQRVTVRRYHDALRASDAKCKQGHIHPRGTACILCNRLTSRRWQLENPERMKEISRRYERKRAKTKWQWHKELPPYTPNPEIIS